MTSFTDNSRASRGAKKFPKHLEHSTERCVDFWLCDAFARFEFSKNLVQRLEDFVSPVTAERSVSGGRLFSIRRGLGRSLRRGGAAPCLRQTARMHLPLPA